MSRQPDLFDPQASGAARDAALHLLDARKGKLADTCRDAMIALYVDRAERVGVAGAWVNGDDATAWLDANAPGHGDNRIVGIVFGKRRGWRIVGYSNSQLAKRHARPMPRWAWAGAP